MMIGYARVSKADGTQTLDLQQYALIQAGVDSQHIYDDSVSGKQTQESLFLVLEIDSTYQYVTFVTSQAKAISIKLR